MKKKTFLKKFFEYGLLISVLLLISNLLMAFIFSSETIDGQSMEPNFTDGDMVLSLRISPIKRGDVIIFKAPKDPDKYYVKRVIGLPGDRVEAKQDRLYINGEIQKEKYLNDFQSEKHATDLTKDFTLQKLQHVNEVPAGEYFVLGDNRTISEDSRSYGFIKRSSIIGKVFTRFWPIGRFKLF
ncbi:signal peptidase I [Xylocopilactobacillus apicola]|uniref:Signal peptidase I n=1 Tax=Xylocopilactobacillus apicola TaxID=2932184 RepID=A0AAU9DHT0_9LACO|nr:signal peptidase I [Xylocopilactobacillus apicola]BDR59595.1 signal peptidase I [Xylocopilactobacillus apicola]